MNLIEVMERFPDQESCISHLEQIRWKNGVCCPHCGSVDVVRKKESGIGRIGRWNCHDCHASFKVTCGTMFHGTKIPLQKWFLAISLVMNAKKSLSSHQLSRDLDLNQKTAWFIMTRIRAEMASQDSVILQGIIEADETYLGGKPRPENRKEDTPKHPRGRGTKKTPILGAVQRGGEVVARVATDLTSRGIIEFLNKFVKPDGSILMTDESTLYNQVEMDHESVNHQECFVDGIIHTNTIEGFWSLLKRAWFGSHHHYERKYTPLYLAEAAFKYNHRKNKRIFATFMRGCFT